MERLVYTEQKKYPEAKKNLRQTAISLAVSASMIWTLCSTFKVEGGFIKLSFANLLGQFANFWNQISEFLLINDGLIIKELAGQTETCSGFLLVATLVGTAVCQMIIKSEKIWLLSILELELGIIQWNNWLVSIMQFICNIQLLLQMR